MVKVEMVFRFLISQNWKLLPNPEPVERKHFFSMSKFVGADDDCGPPQVPGDIQAWQRCTDQAVHRPNMDCICSPTCIFSWCSRVILPGGKKKPLSSKFQHPGFLPAVLSIDLLNYANIAFDLDRKMNSRLSDYMMCNWKLNSADFCFPLKQ